MADLIYNPNNIASVFLLLDIIDSIFDNSHSNWDEMVLIVVLSWIFPMVKDNDS
jgi:hypothetical protein